MEGWRRDDRNKEKAQLLSEERTLTMDNIFSKAVLIYFFLGFPIAYLLFSLRL